MAEQANIQDLLDLMPQPGFCVRDGIILHTNQAARALLLSQGQEVTPLLQNGGEEYRDFCSGHMYLTLSIAGATHNAAVTRMEDWDLFLLDPDSHLEEFRSMELISMELRGPLMNIVTNARQILAQLELEPSDSAARMNRGILQLMRLVSNLSDAGRYQEYSCMEIRDICSLLEELLEKANTLISGNGIRLTWELPEGAIPCLMDPEQIERAVWNLISNAVKFLPGEGYIHVKLSRRGNRLHLSVADSGSGIAQQVRNTVFRHHLRQPGIEDSRFGLGLGMVIVHTAAANHGGTVLIDRNGDSGTRVTMTMVIRQNTETVFRSPILRPDYSGGWDHGLLELSDCLPAEWYREL